MANMELRKEYALIGATLIDGNGGSPVKDTAIVVKNGVIKEVDDRESIKLKEDIQQVDIAGYYVMPGLIDSHIHFNGVTSGEQIIRHAESNYLQAIRTVSETKKVLDHGFTTIRSAGSRYDIYLKRAIEEGTIVGPRIMACGPALCRTGYWIRMGMDEIPDQWSQGVDGVEEIRKAIRKLLAQNVDHIKVLATGSGAWGKNRCEDMHYSMEEMRTFVDEAHMVGLPVMCHAENLRAIRALVELGVDTIEHGDDPERELDEETWKKMAEKNIFLTPTLGVNFIGSWAVKQLPEHKTNSWKRAIENGVKILLGSDAHVAPMTPYGESSIGEIKLLVDILGLRPLEAITSGTKFGAEACGISDWVGTIEKGKLADLLVVKKDPSSNIDVLLNKENIRYVIKEGNLVIEHGGEGM